MIGKNSTTTRQISEFKTGRGSPGRGRGGHNGCGGRGGRVRSNRNLNNPQSDQNTNITTGNDGRSITRRYSRQECQSLSQAEKNKIYRAREHLETARTVAAMIQGDSQSTDDLSTTTASTN